MSETPEPPIPPPASEAPPAASPPPAAEPAPAGGTTDYGAQASAVASDVMADQDLKIAVGGVLVYFLGTLFNWISISIGGLTASASGFSTDRGKTILVMAIAAVVLLYLKKTLPALVVAGLAAAWTLYTVFDIGIGDTGLGMWISLVGAGGLAYAAYSKHSKA